MFHVKNKKLLIQSFHLSVMNLEMVTDPQSLHSLKKYLLREPQQTRHSPSPEGHMCLVHGNIRAGSPYRTRVKQVASRIGPHGFYPEPVSPGSVFSFIK